MLKSNLITALLIVGITFLLVVSPVFGQNASSSAKEALVNCQKVTARINGAVTSAQARIQARQRFAAGRKSHVQDRIQKLQARGADVTKLQADFQQFSALFDTWLADYQKYITLLQAAQNFNCGTSKGQLKTALQQVQNQHAVVRKDREAIKTFYQNTLKPDFKTIRETSKKIKKK